MSEKDGSLLHGIPTRLTNVNLLPQILESDEEYPLPHNYELKRHDVLCGQVKFAGNERFRVIAEMRVQRYVKASCRREKIQIVTEMVDAVRQAGGNFVRLVQMKDDGSDEVSSIHSQQWIDIGNLKAREKASHALRCCASKYQKASTEIPDMVTSPTLEQNQMDQVSKSRKKSKPEERVTPSFCLPVEPPQKKLRTVSSGSSPTKNLRINSLDNVMSLKQKTTPLSLNDIILFNGGVSSEMKILHDLRYEIKEDDADNIHHTMTLLPTMGYSLPTQIFPSSSPMNISCNAINGSQTPDSCPSDGDHLRKHSLLTESCGGLIINDEDLLDLFDF